MKQPHIRILGADTAGKTVLCDALRGLDMPRDMRQLFPEPDMRPDILIVLSASLQAIEQRLDDRGEQKTGANSMEFHRLCSRMYMELQNLSHKHMKVWVFDTSVPQHTPERIADQILSHL